MKRWIITLLLIIATLAGCGPNKGRVEAYKRWYHTRANMLYGVALEHFKIGQLDKARNKSQEALSLSAKFVAARILLGKVYIEQGHYKLAIRELSHLREENPQNAEAIYLLAVAQEKDGQLPEALINYRQAYTLDRSNVSCITAAGEVLVAMGHLKEAQLYIEGYFDQADNEPALYELAGRLATMHRQYDKAVEYFRRARDIDYKNTCYHESLARVQFMAEQYSPALETFKELLETEGYTAAAWVHSTMGDCYMVLGRPRNARDSYYMARHIKGDDPAVWVDVAKAALALNDAPRAILSAREALRLDETNLEAYMALGYALLRDGQTDSAMQELSKAVKLHPSNSMLQCLLGRAYAAGGNRVAARGCYQAALRLEPGNKLAETLMYDVGERQTSAHQ